MNRRPINCFFNSPYVSIGWQIQGISSSRDKVYEHFFFETQDPQTPFKRDHPLPSLAEREKKKEIKKEN